MPKGRELNHERWARRTPGVARGPRPVTTALPQCLGGAAGVLQMPDHARTGRARGVHVAACTAVAPHVQLVPIAHVAPRIELDAKQEGVANKDHGSVAAWGVVEPSREERARQAAVP